MLFLKKLLREEEGATMVEYGLLVALIGIALAATVTGLGGGLDTLFSSATTEVTP
jgi:pilus assembly protein Flp/PilA